MIRSRPTWSYGPSPISTCCSRSSPRSCRRWRSGFLPLEEQAALFIEIAPGIAINTITDAALKQTRVIPGMQIVERAYGLLEVHSFDQGEVRARRPTRCSSSSASREKDRLKPRILSEQTITGIDGHHAALINRMRHGDMITEGQTLYTLEVHPAAYAAHRRQRGREGGADPPARGHHLRRRRPPVARRREAEIAEAARAIQETLAAIDGRENKG